MNKMYEATGVSITYKVGLIDILKEMGVLPKSTIHNEKAFSVSLNNSYCIRVKTNEDYPRLIIKCNTINIIETLYFTEYNKDKLPNNILDTIRDYLIKEFDDDSLRYNAIYFDINTSEIYFTTINKKESDKMNEKDHLLDLLPKNIKDQLLFLIQHPDDLQ